MRTYFLLACLAVAGCALGAAFEMTWGVALADDGVDRVANSWTITNLAPVSVGRVIGSVSITGRSATNDIWVTWDDHVNDVAATDPALYYLHMTGGVTDGPYAIGTGMPSGFFLPAIAASPVNDEIAISTRTECDSRWAACSANVADRQIEAVVIDPVAGTETIEIQDTVNTDLDHGSSSLAYAPDGTLHNCFRVHFNNLDGDELHCSLRDTLGTWGAAFNLSGFDDGADDHARVWVGDTGNRLIGYLRKDGVNERRPGFIVQDDPALDVPTDKVFATPNKRADDVVSGIDSLGGFHLAWKEKTTGVNWKIMRAYCDDGFAVDCDRPIDWPKTTLVSGGVLEGLDMLVQGDVSYFTWTNSGDLNVGWLCPSGVFTSEILDGTGGVESTDLGRPSLWIDDVTSKLYVAYSEDGEGVMLAETDLPTCP